MRRYTRFSNGFSRKMENHIAAVALNYFAYNFIKIRTLRVTPAMAAKVTDRLFDVPTSCSCSKLRSPKERRRIY
jgi:hypothetical protein